jgi:uncharacterized lipoprotein NlpE involved in copper resistance
MKKGKSLCFVLLAVASLFSACNHATETTASTATTIGPADSVTGVTSQVYSDSVGAEGTASTALDYAGVYTGVVPCADCEGIETFITISLDNKFKKTIKYLGKKESKEIKVEGTWSWVNGNVLKLDGVTDAPNQYFVSENKLIQLDMEGKKITGALADKYVLKKLP